MGGYRPTPPCVYVVRWGDVWKVGYTAKQRWRAFALRGGELVDLWEFDTSTAAFAAESLAHAFLRIRGTYAFDRREDAVPFLGGRGDGYAECWRVPDAVGMPDALRTHVQASMPNAMHGRTD